MFPVAGLSVKYSKSMSIAGHPGSFVILSADAYVNESILICEFRMPISQSAKYFPLPAQKGFESLILIA